MPRLLALIAAFSFVASAQDGIEFFENKVRPALQKHCVKCHGPKKQKAKLRLDTPEGIRKGGYTGPAVVLGKPDRSPLIIAVRYTDSELQMPPKGKLDERLIQDLVKWVEGGAAMPGKAAARGGPAKSDFDIDALKAHWAWQPPREVEVPRGTGWCASPIDAFLEAEHAKRGLTPAPDADRRTLARRAAIDLIGLPPTPEEVAEFLSDTEPGAWERYIDRLLASPHFGEKWARHWLDLVRYSETRGFEFDYLMPNAWQYRDYVIRALNLDVPYDVFLTEHVAGDLLDEPRTHVDAGYNEAVLGTGFWVFGEEGHSPVDTRADQLERTSNKIDVFSKAFLGMTVACARCHDHKFDAISAADYYALAGFIHSSSYRQVRFETQLHNAQVSRELEALRHENQAALADGVARKLEGSVRGMAKALKGARRRLLDDAPFHDPALEGWLDHLRGAADDPRDPFHAWAVLAFDPDSERRPHARKRLQEMAKEHAPRDHGLPEKARVIVDWSRPESGAEWYADGPSFGERPAVVGDVRLSDDPAMPISGVVTRSGAVRDPAWNGLVNRRGTERDPNAVNWLQAGRTIRTRSFDLENGMLHYLVRGAGFAFVSLDTHRVVNGPLHGRSVKRWNADGGELRWITHDMRMYRGHRVHVEVSPKDDEPFEIVMIVESERRPRSPSSSNQWIDAVVRAGIDGGLDRMAREYQERFGEALRLFGSGELAEADDAEDAAELADWLVRNWLVLEPHAADASAELRRRSGEVVARRRDLVGSIKRESFLAPSFMDGSGIDEPVLLRGNHKTPGELVRRRFLTAIDGDEALDIPAGSGRLALARRLTRADNPLVSRVMVNRVWHHLFGRGIVASVDNLGDRGQKPTHPELLDWLARDFVEKGWSLKKLIRSIVTTRTYRMASAPDPRHAETDPHNVWLHRMSIRRFRAEAVRDAILTVSGRLDRKMYGKPVPVHLTPFMQGRGRPGSGPLDGHGRRSVYLSVRRNFLSQFFQAFDFPIPATCVGRRTVSNVPAQALALMNDPFVIEQAKLWARRAIAAEPEDETRRLRDLYLAAYSRPPTAAETEKSLAFVAATRKTHGGNAEAAWADLCHVLINAKEFWHLQ